MSAPLTTFSFLSGTRTTEARVITRNPFFNAVATRESAIFLIRCYGHPVLRPSSRAGLYAATYQCPLRRIIVHTLLRQNPDLSVDVLTDAGAVSQHYEDVYELLSLLIWGPWRPRVSPIVQIAPALVPLLPRLAERVVQQACADEDPTA